MRLELAERLLCPSAHAATPLIVVAQESTGRDLRRAQLGCMLCYRTGEVRDGSVILVEDSAALPRTDALNARLQEPRLHEASAQGPSPDAGTDEALQRLAALLGLDEPQMLILLSRRYAALAPLLAQRHEAIIAVYDAPGASPAGVGHLLVAEDRVPFAAGTFAAAALDSSMSAAAMADALRCVRVGGRVVGQSDVPRPEAVRELARDAEGWVGEVEAGASPIVPLRRA